MMTFWTVSGAGSRRTGRTCTPLPPGVVYLSLLEIKVLLTAVRLSDQDAALILDEPDWGLSWSDAVAFVTAVVSAAHARSVPVMLISHKPWWRDLARSVRWVRKETVTTSGSEGCLFRVRIHDEPGGAL